MTWKSERKFVPHNLSLILPGNHTVAFALQVNTLRP